MLEFIAALLIALLLWEVGVRVFRVPIFILPPPSAVFMAAYENAPALIPHVWSTILGTFISLASAAVLGLSVGLLVGYSPLAS